MPSAGLCRDGLKGILALRSARWQEGLQGGEPTAGLQGGGGPPRVLLLICKGVRQGVLRGGPGPNVGS
eukprot:2507841-Pyramimonas_sp.AAC.1